MTAYNGLHKKESVVGLSFNKWTVLNYSHKSSSGNWFYLCKCECGTESKVSISNLRTGKSKQCKICSSKQNGRKGIYAQNKNNDLYVIKCNEIYYKIGTTTNIEERLRTMQAGNPYDLTCVVYEKGRGNEEEYWHKKYEKYALKGEWFVFNVEQIEKVINEIVFEGACEIAF